MREALMAIEIVLLRSIAEAEMCEKRADKKDDFLVRLYGDEAVLHHKESASNWRARVDGAFAVLEELAKNHPELEDEVRRLRPAWHPVYS